MSPSLRHQDQISVLSGLQGALLLDPVDLGGLPTRDPRDVLKAQPALPAGDEHHRQGGLDPGDSRGAVRVGLGLVLFGVGRVVTADAGEDSLSQGFAQDVPMPHIADRRIHLHVGAVLAVAVGGGEEEVPTLFNAYPD